MPLASKKKHSIFKAISDPTRREIFHILIMASVALSINQIADKFKMSRQAVTRHIQVLNKAGLVDIVPKGRERYCYADPKPLREIRDWVSYYEKFWDNKISALDKYLQK